MKASTKSAPPLSMVARSSASGPPPVSKCAVQAMSMSAEFWTMKEMRSPMAERTFWASSYAAAAMDQHPGGVRPFHGKADDAPEDLLEKPVASA
ncbi:hypothetical protein U9M48_034032 [Paspalum notatum var. saurae]|uniref:Uncharacterized protein n=1 Tax=Paspalum notatum var. saurae TaxID=547442 RepID=A0AAQ3UCS1_PASNO